MFIAHTQQQQPPDSLLHPPICAHVPKEPMLWLPPREHCHHAGVALETARFGRWLFSEFASQRTRGYLSPIPLGTGTQGLRTRGHPGLPCAPGMCVTLRGGTRQRVLCRRTLRASPLLLLGFSLQQASATRRKPPKQLSATSFPMAQVIACQERACNKLRALP